MYETSFEFGCLDKHPFNLVSLYRNSFDAMPSRLPKLLGKRGAGGRVFDEDKCRLILLSQRNGHIAELRIFIATAGYIEQIVVALINDQPCRADGPIVPDAILCRGVPALNDLSAMVASGSKSK